MNNIPKISIVTVSYNAVDTIEQTISSVVNQTYENIEYIISFYYFDEEGDDFKYEL